MSRLWVFMPAVLLAFLSSAALAAPAAEDWTSSRSAFDVHACGVDRFVLEGNKGKSTGATAKFTVMPGDDCLKTTGERSEVVLGGWESTSRFKVNGDEGVEFYRVSVKLSSDWIPPQINSRGYAWGIFFQLHGPDELGVPPAIAIHAEDKFSLFVLGGDMNAKLGGRRFLTKSDLNRGRWVDFVLEIKWAPDANGSIAAYRKDEGENIWEKVADIKSVATLQYKGAPIPKPHYWKAGFYRSESQHVNSLWLGPVVRGRSFAEVTGK